jgi:heme-degrading monooxygenase HmoA
MILRMWKASAPVERAEEYVRHVTEKVFPSLSRIEGHCGAYLLRRQVDDGIQFMVLTLWENMESIRRFAGRDTDRAVVEPEARSALKDFDTTVSHFEVLESPAKASAWHEPPANTHP